MENDIELISSSAAATTTLSQQFTSPDSEDHDMVEEISYPAVVSQHFTSWDSDSENAMVDAQQKIPLSEYLQILGWNFYTSAGDQHLKAGRTPRPGNKYPSFDSSYIPVMRNQMSPETKSQLLIDIDAAHEEWLRRKAETFAEKLNRIQMNNINIAAGQDKWFQSRCQTSVAAYATSEVEPFIMDVDAMYEKWLPSQRRMHKVALQLRMKEEQQHSGPFVYDPIMVSLGPYHHRKEEFRKAEEFKYLCLHWCTDGSEETKGRFLNLTLGVIDRVRRSYAEISIVNLYDDDALALMMLLDACFIINFMMIRLSNEIAKDTYNCLGVAGAIPFAARDIMVLENQIPFFVLELLLNEIYGQEGKSMLGEFLSDLMSLDLGRIVIPRQDKDPPIHILEACRRVLVENHLTTFKAEKQEPDSSETTSTWIATIKRPGKETINASKENVIYASSKDKNSSYSIFCPSTTHLKSKGIHFRPSSSHSLNHIKFSSHAFYGLLQLPVCHVSDLTVVFLSNMIAYEIAPDNVIVSPDLEVLSYTNFMKALIQTPADVLELQQKGILRINRYANQEQVVKLFQSIETFNLRNVATYQDVMIRVGEHCNSKAKTWIADLIHSKLNSPWTIIALFSATILLILTFLQTFFTINPA